MDVKQLDKVEDMVGEEHDYDDGDDNWEDYSDDCEDYVDDYSDDCDDYGYDDECYECLDI